MADKESRNVNTLSEFLEWAAQFNDEQYLFRGVKDETYKIEASACRRLPEEHRDNPSRLFRITKRLIEDARSRGHDQKDGRTLSDLELLAELQHFGAATCLIDFTRNALIALWFACEIGSKEENDANGKVIAVRRGIRLKTVASDLINKSIDHFFEVNRETPYQLYQWEPRFQNNRIVAQHSIFVFGGAEVEVEAECVITTGSKLSISKSLREVSDITEASMYPDFDGFARLHAHDRLYAEPDIQAYFQRGTEAVQRDDWDTAIEYYTEVISSVAASTSLLAWAYNNRGAAYNQKGAYDRTIADITKMIELRPDDPEAYRNRGAAYNNKGEYELAIGDYEKAMNLKPDNAELYHMRGAAYYSKDEYEFAVANFDRAIELNPNDARAYSDRGMACYRTANFDSAITNFSRAIHLDPNSVQVYCNRGEAWLHLRDWEKAKSDLIIAKDKGLDIIASFRKDYESVEDFEQKNNAKLSEDIAEMLTPTAD